jgi:hypothetical protein
MGRADEKVGTDNAERIIQKAKDMGWEPDERQERLASGVLSTLTPLNILSLFVTGPEQLTMRALAEGATFLGLSAGGGVAASELFPDQPLAPLVGALGTPILGPAAFRGLRAGVRTPLVEDALRARQPAQAEVNAALGGRQGGQVDPQFAMRLGGAAIGGYAGYQSTPEDAGPVERAGRTLGGIGLGLAAPGLAQAAIRRPQLDQAMLESLRRGGVTAGPPAPSGRSVGLNVGTVMDMTKQGILLDPVGRAMDMVSNTIELLRQPAALTLAGRGPEAAAGMAALTHAIPEALQNAKLGLQGMQVPTLGQGAQWTGRSGAVFRVMGAADMFTRTLGEYQGMAAKGLRMLDEAGLKPGTPQADQYLAQHADELYREGARSGATSVFGQAKQAGQQSSRLDQMMAAFSSFKDHLLSSPSLRDKAIGTLLDFEVPFSGTPSRVWQMALQRVPGITQAAGVGRIAKALEKGDTFAAQKAFGEMALESMIQAQIAQGIREGFITGPDDPEHPSSVQIAGQWIPIRTFGVYGVPMGVMAAFAESWEKTGRQPDPETTDRFAAALNASMKPISEGVPGFSLVKTLASVGTGTGFTRAVTDIGSDVLDRFNPSILARAENMVDPYVRDIARRGPEQLWEPTFARNPFLAQLLPPKLDPTTGEPRERGISILGGATKPSSELTAELARLKRKGYEISPPDDKPSSVTINGVPVPVKDGSPEQRAMVKARGQLLAEIGQQMKQPSYASMTDDQKAQMWSSLINRSANVQAGAWLQSVDPVTAGRILSRGRPIAGRLQDMDETERINQQVALTNQMRRQQQVAMVGA